MFDGVLGTVPLGDTRALHIAPLSRQTIIDNEADHLGFGGYFIFETDERVGRKGIHVLARTASLDAAFKLLDIWRQSAARTDRKAA